MHKQNRRTFIAAATTLSASAALSTLPATAQPVAPAKRLAHHVFFWLKNPASVEDRDKLIEGIRTLSAIETVRGMHVGVVASTEKRDVVENSWQVSELLFFDDLAGQATYQTHPVHLAFVKNYSHLWQKVVVFDAMEV